MTDETLTYPTDEQACEVCGKPAIAWPEGAHHVDEALDDDHPAVITEWER